MRLKLIPGPCGKPTMGEPIRRFSTRHPLGISPVGWSHILVKPEQHLKLSAGLHRELAMAASIRQRSVRLHQEVGGCWRYLPVGVPTRRGISWPLVECDAPV